MRREVFNVTNLYFGDKKWPAETAEALPCGNLGHGGFSWAEQERKLHIKSFADTRDWLLSAASVRHSVVTHLALPQQAMSESMALGC